MAKMIFYAGAHKGEEITSLIERQGYDFVVAIEPQKELCEEIKKEYPMVTVINAALWDSSGKHDMYFGGYSTLATLVKARTLEGRFKDYGWGNVEEVRTITLDELIASFGVPDTITMDIEGAEKLALAGLSQPVKNINFEYNLDFPLDAVECLTRIEFLGKYEYTVRMGESTVIDQYMELQKTIELLNYLSSTTAGMWGMINAANQEM